LKVARVRVIGLVDSAAGAVAAEHPVAMIAKAAAPAMAATAVVRRENFTVTPLCAWVSW
jgi:hypothetical protein